MTSSISGVSPQFGRFPRRVLTAVGVVLAGAALAAPADKLEPVMKNRRGEPTTQSPVKKAKAAPVPRTIQADDKRRAAALKQLINETPFIPKKLTDKQIGVILAQGDSASWKAFPPPAKPGFFEKVDEQGRTMDWFEIKREGKVEYNAYGPGKESIQTFSITPEGDVVFERSEIQFRERFLERK